MQFATILGIAGCSVAMVSFAWHKKWLPALAYAFGLSYIIFDKVYPSLLPDYLVIGFSVTFLALALIFCWQAYSSRKIG
ncbi:hypothetical protein ACFFKC_17635 [Pseudoduganella danionis]|uniref:Uncharacterized protein n=1 Tax=Pseudoduganella danionis TaxID=1890295 RepID=A0ABW9SQ14_9BURK|nr:hypothetical protein [Pseudoduganella danionis]MTW33711.1 hypothetical protein [Pseudoduganella danionis]